MADTISPPGDAVQIAKLGLSIVEKLRQYKIEVGERSPVDFVTIALDIEVTADVLGQVDYQLDTGSYRKLAAEDALETAQRTVEACRSTFQRIDDYLASVIRKGSDGTPAICRLARSDWRSWREGHLKILMADLARHKTTLLLVLAVLSLKSHRASSSEMDQVVLKFQIRSLYAQLKSTQSDESKENSANTDGLFDPVTGRTIASHWSAVDIDKIDYPMPMRPKPKEREPVDEEYRKQIEDIDLVLLQAAQSVGSLMSMIVTETHSWNKSQRMDSVALKAASDVAKSRIDGLLGMFEDAQRTPRKLKGRKTGVPRITDLAKKGRDHGVMPGRNGGPGGFNASGDPFAGFPSMPYPDCFPPASRPPPPDLSLFPPGLVDIPLPKSKPGSSMSPLFGPPSAATPGLVDVPTVKSLSGSVSDTDEVETADVSDGAPIDIVSDLLEKWTVSDQKQEKQEEAWSEV